MKHKTIVKVAVVMLVVFGATVLLYPTLFSSELRGKTPIEAQPVAPVTLGK